MIKLLLSEMKKWRKYYCQFPENSASAFLLDPSLPPENIWSGQD